MVRLNENADAKRLSRHFHESRRRSDSAFEAVANHARAGADVALIDGTICRAFDRTYDVFGPNVLTVDVVEQSVVGLRH